MSYAVEMRRLLDENPGMTEAEIIAATGWTKRRVQKSLYDLQWAGEINVLPKRFALTKTLAEKAGELAAKKAATHERRLRKSRERRRAKTVAKRKVLEIPKLSTEEIVACAKKSQHPLAAAWGREAICG